MKKSALHGAIGVLMASFRYGRTRRREGDGRSGWRVSDSIQI